MKIINASEVWITLTIKQTVIDPVSEMNTAEPKELHSKANPYQIALIVTFNPGGNS